MITINETNICKKLFKTTDGTIVIHNNTGEPYDYAEVCKWAEEHPESVEPMPEPTEKELAPGEIDELQKYLDDTDWYATRLAETGEAIPEDVKSKRQEARDKISELRTLL